MKQIDSLKMKKLAPKPKTINLLLKFSKNLEILRSKHMCFMMSKN